MAVEWNVCKKTLPSHYLKKSSLPMLQNWTCADGNTSLLEVNTTALSSLDEWEAFTEVPPEKWSTCLGHDASAVPLDGQHHMHDLHVSSKQHCQQGSCWPLHLSFLLKNIENKTQFLSPALHGVLCDFICGLACYPLLHPFLKILKQVTLRMCNWQDKTWSTYVQGEAHAVPFFSLLKLVSGS